MLKGDTCEYCGEEMIGGCVVVEYEGQKFQFCDSECKEEWVEEKLEPFTYIDDVVEEY